MKHRSPRLFSTINIAAFSGVLLVLLFLLASRYASHLHRTPIVDLAKIEHPIAAGTALREDAIIITLQRDGRVFVGTQTLPDEELGTALKQVLTNRGKRKVYLNADARVAYRNVMSVMDELHAAGIADVVFLVNQSRPRIASQ